MEWRHGKAMGTDTGADEMNKKPTKLDFEKQSWARKGGVEGWPKDQTLNAEKIAKAQYQTTYRARKWHFPKDTCDDLLAAAVVAVQEVLSTFEGRNLGRIVAALRGHRPRYEAGSQTRVQTLIRLACIRAENAMRVLADGRKAQTLALGSGARFDKGQADGEGDFLTKPMKAIGETLETAEEWDALADMLPQEEAPEADDFRTAVDIADAALTHREAFLIEGVHYASSVKRFVDRQEPKETAPLYAEIQAAFARREMLLRAALANELELERFRDVAQQGRDLGWPLEQEQMRRSMTGLLTVTQRKDPKIVALFMGLFGINIQL